MAKPGRKSKDEMRQLALKETHEALRDVKMLLKALLISQDRVERVIGVLDRLDGLMGVLLPVPAKAKAKAKPGPKPGPKALKAA